MKSHFCMACLVLKLTGDDTNRIRGMLAPDRMQVFSVYDFMTKVCGYKDTGATARTEFKRVCSIRSESRDEILPLRYDIKFPGSRGPATPCMTTQGLLMLSKCLLG
jgi:hypothetical protein